MIVVVNFLFLIDQFFSLNKLVFYSFFKFKLVLSLYVGKISFTCFFKVIYKIIYWLIILMTFYDYVYACVFEDVISHL